MSDDGKPQLRKFSIFPDRKDKLSFDNPAINGDPDMEGENIRMQTLNGLTDSHFTHGSAYSRKYSVSLKTLKPFRPSSKDGKIPVNKAGFFSYITISWMSSLVMKIYRHRDEALKEEDIWKISDWESCDVNTDRLEQIWEKEVASHGEEGSSFLRAWLKFIQTRLYIKILLVCINAVLTFFMSGFITNLVVSYLESESSDLGYAMALLAGNLVGQVLRATSFVFIIFFGVQTGIRFRAGMLGVVYKKILKLKSVKGKVASEIVTIFGADSMRVFINCISFVYLLALPVYVIIGTAYAYYLIGYWCFIALGSFLICYQLQAQLTIVVASLRRKTLIHTDKRIRKMTEVLNSMKMIKMYGWEESFQSAITAIRKSEVRVLRTAAIINSITNAIIPVTPSIASVATIATYRAFGNELTASTAFALVSTLDFLRIIVSFVPFATRTLGESRITFERVKKLMLRDEYQAPSSEVLDDSNAVEIQDAVFQWTPVSDIPDDKSKKREKKKKKNNEDRASISSLLLDSIDLNVKKGQLVGICGAVGCGKSSLISAILGRMPQSIGHLAVHGSVAYAAQQAWIFNGTLKDNIVFGQPYDADWYKQVIYACGLEPDLDLLANGDETEIGEKGINISGGQKQRLSLARAVYSKSDIYLLDDPLSAVDVHVGRHLFHKCIKKMLAGKTVILVTHQLQYLKHCDEILVMAEGRIAEHGSHEYLLDCGGYYGSMMGQFHATSAFTAATGKEATSSSRNEDDQGSSDQRGERKVKSGKDEQETSSTNESKGKLTQKEDAGYGMVTFGTYKSYIDAAGGFGLAAAVLLLYILSMGIVVFGDWWLGIWLGQTTKSGILESAANMTVNNTLSTTMSTPSLNQTIRLPTEEQTSGVDFYLTIYLATLAAIIVFTTLKGVIASTVMVKASGRLHNRALDKVMKAPMAFFDANPPGRILNRFSRDLDEGDVFLPNLLDVMLQIVLMVLMSLISSAVNLPWIAIAFLPVVVVYYWFKKISAEATRQLKRFENVARSPLINHVTTSGTGLSTIVSFNQQTQFIVNCMKYTDVTSTGLMLFEGSMRWIELRLDIASSLLVVATTMTMILTKGSISPALAALSLSLTIRVVSVMQFVVRVMNETEARFTSIQRLHEYESSLETETDTTSVVPDESWPREGRLIFSDVLMCYRKDMDPVLRNIHFNIHPKQKVGIVGRTGAGKSSLAAALFRLCDLTEGHIYIDGVDIAHIPRKVLRSRLSTIPQDPVLFAGTLRYNLDPFSKYTDEVIWTALEQVHMKEKIRQFGEQLDFQVEENGENFSVGERQLICLARAVLRRNKILVLDEATASIDTSTDALIQKTIRDSFSDCTVLTIAHRLNTVLHCDTILIMEAGEILETGHPQNLLANPNSVFNRMIRAQTVKTPSP
ncbi:multidrug resistance-associated protein 5-like [Mizuhopecten yessoensis]|uniref:Multidrug resistance-associated protein 5 n=1 Tax=Mizuhopecten yessoensis TaxID=6573 RepID=A0A210PT90_MIZYE|nr:multidrug resistance-associated protein 5-like [Mizuhopecten yessoensis]XP_021375732.1 multidrug resistance-associated protein 5-like [Mizuhopecten yessoensis]XP_021375733.1 multidrug resistance-associated protein 5-like [Mizuhopecten yessoensis]XP_021375734.1 multidrug resistance-associated protein 5-like [Mizuhopecten yessoensis]OWF39710.1 Multidrug resistance-associated protein 5 [Mizuhopecten yessoensis]